MSVTTASARPTRRTSDGDPRGAPASRPAGHGFITLSIVGSRMALIEITVDNPALIRTGEEETERETTGTDGGTAADVGERETDEETDLIETVGTFVTALSALAGVLQRLRSEEEETPVDEEIGGDVDDDLDEIDEIDEIEGTDEIDETEDETLETGLEGEEEPDEGASGSGLGTKVAVLLVIALVVAVLWFRSGDEGDGDEFEV